MTVTALSDVSLDEAVAKAHLAILRAQLGRELVLERVCEIHEQCVIARENLSRLATDDAPASKFGSWVFLARLRE